jgi:RNA polymerase-binding transcription factor DksA
VSEPSPAADAGVRAVLNAERAATLARIEGLNLDRAAILDSSASASTDDEHDPEGATLAFEREQITALLDQARAHLVELENAVARFDDGNYGRCERCGKPIALARLAARPASVTCVACAARH